MFTEESAKETIEKLTAQGDDTARIVIPDTKDVVAEVNVSIPKTSLTELKKGRTNVEIETENAKLTIPNSTLAMFNEDLYFRVIPIKDTEEKNKVKERALKEEEVRQVANGRDIQVIGRPAEIETNMQSYPVKVTLPLNNEDLPNNETDRQSFLKDLVIYIEHSDGSKELVRGDIVTYKDGTIGIEFGINKFSTFTMVYMEGSDEYFAQKESQKDQEIHEAYIMGYPDRTFKPSKSLTRAEMATLLVRNLTVSATEGVEFSDLKTTHWAYENIHQVVQSGLMNGYPTEEFKPDQTITRAEMAAIVFKWKQLQLDNTHLFKDTTNHWAANMISACVEEGYMKGFKDGSFKPQKSLTRAEAVKVINNVLRRGPLKGVATPTWLDVPATHWAFGDIEEASMSHSFEEFDGTETLVERKE